jgi:hypothetical protein
VLINSSYPSQVEKASFCLKFLQILDFFLNFPFKIEEENRKALKKETDNKKTRNGLFWKHLICLVPFLTSSKRKKVIFTTMRRVEKEKTNIEDFATVAPFVFLV